MNSRVYSVMFLCFLLILPAATHAETAQDGQIIHLLNRISYGPAPQDIAQVRKEGIQIYIEQQLHPEDLPKSSVLEQELEQLLPADKSLQEIVRQFQPNYEEGKLSLDERRELNKKLNTILFQMSEGKILRAIESPAQLQEVMTDFWFNHFNVFFNKGLDRVFISTYERDAIRPYALGKFSDLLKATARHPAMLFYLDNWQNKNPNNPVARNAQIKRGKELGINENFAREIMELHTLGVNGGYSQLDVTNLAHILTGWGIGRGKDWRDKATFEFDAQHHDYNDAVLLGQHIRGGGMEEIDGVLDMLAANPATAQHIAYELAQYFVADDPPESLVKKLAVSFQNSGGDIAAMLKELFYAPEFWDAKYDQVKFKPPFRYIVSAYRASGLVPTGDTRILQGAIGNMGEPLYRCLTPNGYSMTNDQWLNSDSLLKRISIAKAISQGFDEQTSRAILQSRSNGWSSGTLQAVKAAARNMQPALLLSSPEFLYY